MQIFNRYMELWLPFIVIFLVLYTVLTIFIIINLKGDVEILKREKMIYLPIKEELLVKHGLIFKGKPIFSVIKEEKDGFYYSVRVDNDGNPIWYKLR
jgi:hypothetical protein